MVQRLKPLFTVQKVIFIYEEKIFIPISNIRDLMHLAHYCQVSGNFQRLRHSSAYRTFIGTTSPAMWIDTSKEVIFVINTKMEGENLSVHHSHWNSPKVYGDK